MKSAFAKFYQSGASPGEELRKLANYVADKRKDGLLIFCAERMTDPDMMKELHKQHEAELRRQANLIERAANGQ